MPSLPRFSRAALPLHAVAILFLATTALRAQSLPAPSYVPPDLARDGVTEHFRELAVIETDCRSMAETVDLVRALTERGALISLIWSPDLILGWVPAPVREAVLDVPLSVAGGGTRSVLAVSYTASECRQRLSAPSGSETAAQSLPLFTTLLERMKDRDAADYLYTGKPYRNEQVAEVAFKPMDCGLDLPEGQGAAGSSLAATVDTTRSTRLQGLIHVDLFFLESDSLQPRGDLWDWDPITLQEYELSYVFAVLYWTDFAARYGVTATFHTTARGPADPLCQIRGEAALTDPSADVVRNVLCRAMNISTGLPAGRNASDYALEVADSYNERWRSGREIPFVFFHEAVVLMIARNMADSIPDADHKFGRWWPSAWSIRSKQEATWTLWKGEYVTMDTWYYGRRPVTDFPHRNVIAHELGHMWGALDEYDTKNCDDIFRESRNLNCQTVRPAPGTPSPGRMRGFEGIMGANYTQGSSSVTPVFTGVCSEPARTPLRLIRCVPDTIQAVITLRTCDLREGNWPTYLKQLSEIVDTYGAMHFPMDFDFCHIVDAPAIHQRYGVDYVFSRWLIRRQDGSDTSFSEPSLQSAAIPSTRQNPATEIAAEYTKMPSGWNQRIASLSAWLAPDNCLGRQCEPAVLLRWINTLNTYSADVTVEVQLGSGLWAEIDAPWALQRSGVNEYGGMFINRVPDGSGNMVPLQPDREYAFRAAYRVNQQTGPWSIGARVRIRPAAPVDTTFCYDATEATSPASRYLLHYIPIRDSVYAVRAACTIPGKIGAFLDRTPKGDYYRMPVTAFGAVGNQDHFELTFARRPGSLFSPAVAMRDENTGESINAMEVQTGVYRLFIWRNGNYNIDIVPRMSDRAGFYNLVDPREGHFGFGEYTLTVARRANPRVIDVPPGLVRLFLPPPFRGFFVANPPLDLIGKGRNPRDSVCFPLKFLPLAGLQLDAFRRNFGSGVDLVPENPAQICITPSLPPGLLEFTPLLSPFAGDVAEVVVIHPDGPAGTLDIRETLPRGNVYQAKASAAEGYDFIGWAGDTAATSNPLPVTMWRDMLLIALYKQKPCPTPQMTPWYQVLNVESNSGYSDTLAFGMAPGAGDGLEAGQYALPPAPAGPDTSDVRWTNIPAVEGSRTDIRAVASPRTYHGRVQVGTLDAPLTMSWNEPPPEPDARYRLHVDGRADTVDMRSVFGLSLSAPGVYTFTVEVRTVPCPPKPVASATRLQVLQVDSSAWPELGITLLARNMATGEPVPLFHPFAMSAFARDASGADAPLRFTAMAQYDTSLYLRVRDPRADEAAPSRPLSLALLTSPEDPDMRVDSLVIPIGLPLPAGPGDALRVALKHGGGWELLSPPVDLRASFSRSLFAGQQTLIYAFDAAAGSYTDVDALAFGSGYWVKTPEDSTVFLGYRTLSHTWNTLRGAGEGRAQGWNLIGALSKEADVASILQTPPGGLKAILGWDPAAGYRTPSQLEAGKGYWVRVADGTVLSLQASPLRGGAGTETPFQKAAGELPLAGRIRFTASDGRQRLLSIASECLTPEQQDLLRLPPPPPRTLFEVRTDGDLQHVAPGITGILVQGTDETEIRLETEGGRLDSCALFDDRGALLFRFEPSGGDGCRLRVDGGRVLRLQIAARRSAPAALSIGRNYPNPCAAGTGTAFRYSLPGEGTVTVAVYDAWGRRVRTLFSGTRRAGSYELRWDGLDQSGRAAPSGIYFARLEHAGRIVVRSIVVQ